MKYIKLILNNSFLNLAARLILGVIFILSGVAKIGEPAAFAKEIANYNMMPNYLINIWALTLPWIELICGLFLMVGIRLKANSIVSSGLYLIFNIAIAYAMLQGLNINCGCHAALLAEQVGFPKIFQNTSLLLLSLNLFFNNNNKFTLENIVIKELQTL